MRLRSISNFTDFDPFELEPDVHLQYSDRSSDIENADMVIVPGSKNTVHDLLHLKDLHLDESIRRAAARGVQIIGICGGYQMLGKRIVDEHGVESEHRSIDGIGLLNIETIFGKEKTTCRAEAEIVRSSEFGVLSAEWNFAEKLNGYEIHMGMSTGDIGLFKVNRLAVDSALRTSHSELVLDGSLSGNCWGTYLHGIFDNDSFRRGILNAVRVKKGLASLTTGVSYDAGIEQALDRLAAAFREHVDMRFIEGLL